VRQLLSDKSGEVLQHGPSGRGGAVAEVIESGDFRIDLSKRTAALRGRELDLNSEEFDVLVFLAGHRQRLVTPRTMLATGGTTNRVRRTEFLRALLSLSKKLDVAGGPEKRYIRTEPWVVYRFDPAASSAI
jgi:two-component system KDP operon response regulator KdpE